MGGRDDAQIDPATLESWSLETHRPAPVELFPGGHFFVQSARAEVLAVLSERLRRLTGAHDSQGIRP
jgi:surfactin synthase thioesterase subunit